MHGFSPRSLAYCAFFAALIMVGAMIRIPLPPIPFTMQTMFVFLSGLVLGPRLGFFSALLYLSAGLIGLPVFANGGGFLYVLQPSFGYILSFCPASYLIGRLCQRRPEGTMLYRAFCCFLGLMLIYIVGMTYMAAILKLYLGRSISLWQIVSKGALVFLPGDVLWCFLSAWFYNKLPKSLLPKGL